MPKVEPEFILTDRIASLVRQHAIKEGWYNNRGTISHKKVAKESNVALGTIYALLRGAKRYPLSLGNSIKLANMVGVNWETWIPEEQIAAA